MIVLDDDREYHLEERAAEMIRFVLQRVETIATSDNVKVEHNCAGTKIHSKLTVFECEAKVTQH